MHTEAILTEFVQRELARGRAASIQPHDDLLGSGIIDSLGILQLVQFVEERFKFTIPDEDVVIENFQSVAALTSYLEQHQAA